MGIQPCVGTLSLNINNTDIMDENKYLLFLSAKVLELEAEIEKLKQNNIKVATAKPQSLEDIQIEVIADVLDRNDHNRTKSAEELGISRRTLHRWIKDYPERLDVNHTKTTYFTKP